MRTPPLAPALAVLGALTFGVAVGGMASVDDDLRAATPAPAFEVRQVVDRSDHGHDRHRERDHDCPRDRGAGRDRPAVLPVPERPAL